MAVEVVAEKEEGIMSIGRWQWTDREMGFLGYERVIIGLTHNYAQFHQFPSFFQH